MLDALGSRRLFAGVVTVITDYGPDHRTLIKGDANANEIYLEAVYANSYEEEFPFQRMIVYNGRLVVDGVSIAEGHLDDAPDGHPYWYGGATLYVDSSPLFDLGDGDDVLRLDTQNGNAFGDVGIYAGRGNDRITADGTFGSLKIDSGEGDDRVNVIGRVSTEFTPYFNVSGDVDIATGQGKDRIALLGANPYDGDGLLRIGGRIRISDNSGPTQVTIEKARIRRATTILLNRSNDAINVTSTKFGSETRFLTGDGNDTVRFFGKVVVPDIMTALRLGPGGDTFTAERF